MEKDFNDGRYWDAFEKGYLHPSVRPTPQEVGEFIVGLFVKIDRLEKDAGEARHEAKCAHQQFEVFAMEIANLAAKRKTFGKHS